MVASVDMAPAKPADQTTGNEQAADAKKAARGKASQ